MNPLKRREPMKSLIFNSISLIIIAINILLFIGCTKTINTNPNFQPGNYDGTISVDNLERTYTFHIPLTYDKKTTRPLLIALHGRYGTGYLMKDLTLNQFDTLADLDDVIVVYPDGIDKFWNYGSEVLTHNIAVDDVNFISKLISFFY